MCCPVTDSGGFFRQEIRDEYRPYLTFFPLGMEVEVGVGYVETQLGLVGRKRESFSIHVCPSVVRRWFPVVRWKCLVPPR